MHIRTITIFALPLILCGCFSSRNISTLDPFCDFVGRDVELQRPVYVVHHCGVFLDNKAALASLHSAKYGLVDEPKQYYGPVINQLPVGHRVKLTVVRDEIWGDSEGVFAYGWTVVPPGTNEVRFAYEWGGYWLLHRAPWEDENTPPERGFAGRLPAHFDYDMFKAAAGTPQWGTNVLKH